MECPISGQSQETIFCILNITQDEPTSSTAPWASGRCCRLYHSGLITAELKHKMIVSLSGIIINILLHWCSFHSFYFFPDDDVFLSCPDKECTRCAISLECLQMMFPSSNKGLCGYLKRPPTWVRIPMIHVGTRLFGSIFMYILGPFMVHSHTGCVASCGMGTLQYFYIYFYHCGLLFVQKTLNRSAKNTLW